MGLLTGRDRLASIRARCQGHGWLQHCTFWMDQLMSTTPKFCASCGTPLAEGAKFCASCGTPVQAAAPAAEAKEAAPAAPAAPKPVAPAPAPVAFKDPLSSLLAGGDSDSDDDDDRLAPPHAAGPVDGDDEPPAATKKSLPIGMIAMGALVALAVGVVAWVNSDEERLATFKCKFMGDKESCITKEDRLAELEEQRAKEEVQLMTALQGSFDLSYSPKEDTFVTIVQKRYEESRDDFVKRVRDGGPDTRELKDTLYGYSKEVKAGEGQSKLAIEFVTKADWETKNPERPKVYVPKPTAPKAGEPPLPANANGTCDPGETIENAPADCKPTPPDRPYTVWPKPLKEVILPVSLANLPMLEKEQADGTGKRLTAEAVAELKVKREASNKTVDEEGNVKQDPSLLVKTDAVSTWVYEIEMWAPGYKNRSVLFYDDPAPPALKIKELETQGWTARKFKKTPEGKLVIDMAAFDLLPEPRTIRIKLIQLQKELFCMRKGADFQGKNEQAKKDAEDLLWEQKAFSKETRAIAELNFTDPVLKPEFEAIMAKEMTGYVCPTAAPQ